jgi:hypothetical protein
MPEAVMRDIRVQVLLTPEEFLSLSHLADASGESHSGLFRRLLLREARMAASSLAEQVGAALVNSILAEQAPRATADPAQNMRT